MVGALVRRGVGHSVARANVLLPGVYAWVTTVAHPVSHADAAGSARLVAAVAFACLLTGVALVPNYARAARALGILSFVPACLLVWILLGPAIAVEEIHPVRACFGALGWILYAFGWGAVRGHGTLPEGLEGEEQGEGATSVLVARGYLPRAAVVVMGMAVAGALLPAMLAWRVTRPQHALWAHGIALLCSIAVVVAGSSVALAWGHPNPTGTARYRLRVAMGSLSVLAFALAAGALWRLLG